MQSFEQLRRELYAFQYPGSYIQDHGGIPQNTGYECVSSTILNGLVNYGYGHVGFIIARYGLVDVKTRESIVDSSHEDPEKAYLDFATQLSKEVHFMADGDDWLILYETSTSYMFMWYNRDTSDCSVERWSKESCVEVGVFDLEQFIDKRIDLLIKSSHHTLCQLFGRPIVVRAPHKLSGCISG